MKVIFLSNGEKTIVDDDDYERYGPLKWYCWSGYARRTVRIDGKNCAMLLHREITNAPKGMDVDHINRNRLDNRKANLRIIPRKYNSRNSSIFLTNTSGYKGVSYCKSRGKWSAQISVNNKMINLGRYLTKEEAAAAYNEAAIRHYGEYAAINVLGSPSKLISPPQSGRR